MIRQSDVTRAVKGAIDEFRKAHPGERVGCVSVTIKDSKVTIAVDRYSPKAQPEISPPAPDNSPVLPRDDEEFMALQTGRAYPHRLGEPACWGWVLPPENKLDARDLLRSWNHGVCAICSATNRYARIVEDHDHDTSLIRGYLCSSCNTGENGSTQWVGYRERNPATILGLKLRFRDKWGKNAPDGFVRPDYIWVEKAFQQGGAQAIADAIGVTIAEAEAMIDDAGVDRVTGYIRF